MRDDIYQAETQRIAAEQHARPEQARHALQSAGQLSLLEQGGVLHALQVLIENAIGKAKRMLKEKGVPVPVSAYDAFSALVTHGLLRADDLPKWNAIVGLRKRLVHDYMNVDMDQVLALVAQERERFVVAFLLGGEAQTKRPLDA